MEERKERTVFQQLSSQICSFTAIAKRTGIRQIVKQRLAAVFQADNVVYMKSEKE